jgi:hypothetical protein
MPRLSRRCRSLSLFALSRDRARQLFVADNLHILLDGDYHELNATNDSFMLLAGLTRLHRLMTHPGILLPDLPGSTHIIPFMPTLMRMMMTLTG